VKFLDDKGNVTIIVALCMPLLIGAVAFGVEVGFWRYDQVRLQKIADASAFTAAVVKRAGGTDYTTQATTSATTNGYTTTTDTIAFHAPSTTTPSDASSVEVVLTRTEPQWFTALFTSHAEVITARATATYNSATDACILALNPSAQKAVDFAGNSGLTLDGCSVMSDSIASNGFNMQGSSTASAPCIYSAGGASLGGSLTLTTCAGVKTYQPPVADPFASLAMPATPSGNCKNLHNNNSTPNGNFICGDHIKNSVDWSTGSAQVFVIDGSGGDLTVDANVTFTCNLCTFYLINGAGLKINGNSTVNLSAPTSGTYSGMLILGGRTSNGTVTINGTNTSQVTGSIYLPDGSASYLGNFAGTNGCTQIIAQTVAWSGDTTFADALTSGCAATGMQAVPVATAAKLSA
jgi:Flp pilus assembly protein TadG